MTRPSDYGAISAVFWLIVVGSAAYITLDQIDRRQARYDEWRQERMQAKRDAEKLAKLAKERMELAAYRRTMYRCLSQKDITQPLYVGVGGRQEAIVMWAKCFPVKEG